MGCVEQGKLMFDFLPVSNNSIIFIRLPSMLWGTRWRS